MTEDEKAVLGLVMNNPENYPIVEDYLQNIDFSERRAANIWSNMQTLALVERLPPSRQYVANFYAKSDWHDELIEILADCCRYFEGDILHHAKKVKKSAKDRAFLYKLKIAPEQDRPAPFVMDALEQYMKNDEQKIKTFKDLISTVVDTIDRASEGITGIQTGISGLDRITGGLQRGKVYTIAARPGVGKTAIATQITVNLADRGVPVGVCSLEMGDDELGLRSLAFGCQTSMSGLYRADHEALSKMSAMMSHKCMANYPIYFDTETYEMDDIAALIRFWKTSKNIDVVVVDHIGLTEVRSASSKVETVSYTTRTLKKLAKSLDIAVIMTSQLNREIEKSNRRPKLSDLKSSGSIEEDSDFVMFLHEQFFTSGEYDRHLFGVEKNRQGRKGDIGYGFHFNGDTQTFTEIAPEDSSWSQ